MNEASVWIAGGVGLSIVLRAGALYGRTDRLAFGLVALIGVALCLGVAELVMRVRRAAELAREVSRLPSAPTESEVDATSPELRAVLRARIAGVPAAAGSPPIASYLLGLLVMIGLLGTFLGLFESLRGAREALGSSGDVTALRAALGAPMQGLARAFGTSAAGVSASAMLGLALVIVRRHEATVASDVARYCAGPLSSLTVARRTLDALEAIARQGSSLPAASEAITRGANAMSDVAREVAGSLERTSLSIAGELQGVARAVREDLGGASEATARAVANAVTPRLESAVTRVIESAAKEASATIARLDTASEARIAREATHARELREGIDRAVEKIADAHRVEGENLRESIARETKNVVDTVIAGRDLMIEAETERSRAIAGAMTNTTRALADRLDATVETIAAKLQESVASTAQAIDAQRSAAAEADVVRAERLDGVIASIETRIAEAAVVSTERTEAILTRLDTVTTRFDETLAGATTRLDATLAGTAARLASTLGETATHLRDTLGEAALKLDETLGSSAKKIDTTFGATATQLAEYVEKLAAIRQELRADDDLRADRLIAQTEERLDQLAKTVSESLATSMERVVASAQAAPEAAARVIDDAAARLKAQSEADAERDALLLEMVEKFDALAKAIDARAAEHHERVAGLEEKLQLTYAQTAESWSEKLVEHQKAIEEAASQTNTFVREAAEALQRGGADLTSMSELFGTSVDRYRDASEKWLTGLSVLRAAAERAAQADAQDMLAAYLEQTREVFDSTLQFQRQLFNELRRIETRDDVITPRLLATGTSEAEAEE